MKPTDYLEKIRIKLKGFSRQERADFIDEIASHIESGQEDASFGEERVMAELGTPEQLERGLRNVYRPNRLVDLLLVLIPELILFFNPIQRLLNIFYGPFKESNVLDPHLYLGGRIALVLAILLAVIGLQRRSIILIILWLTDGIGTLVSIMTREGRFIPGQERIPGSMLESLLLYLILIILVLWLIRILKQNKFDLLLVVYALLPLMVMGANYSTIQIINQSDLAVQAILTVLFGLLGILTVKLAWAVGISIFFMFQPRMIRWIGLVLVGADYVFLNIFKYSGSAMLLLVWSAILAVVLLGWLLDWHSRRADARLIE